MIFSEKLNFLLKLTDTSNKQLASALSVDPSLISRMRQGRRMPPQNSAHSVAMGNYFAKKCTTDYQRSALAETIGQNRIKLILKNEVLASILSEWIMGDNPSAGRKVEQFIHEMESDLSTVGQDELIEAKQHLNEVAHSRAYYGNAGKRAAVRAFASVLLRANAPRTILITSDESLEWLTENPSFSVELYNCLMSLIEQGYSFKRISSKFWDTTDAIDSLNRWLPVYMQGKLETWYYPRIRDNVFHRTIIVAPGLAAIGSDSVGYHAESSLTFLNINADMANVAANSFNDYLAKCVPLTVAHSQDDPNESICDCLSRYLRVAGNRCAKYIGLPPLITPSSVLHRAFINNQETINTFNEFYREYEQTLRLYKRTDVIVLADPQEVLQGKVLCTASLIVPNNEPYYYTPQDYVEHLQTLLQLMETHPDYLVVTMDSNEPQISICAIDGGISYIMRGINPTTLLEISEQNFVAAVGEYILNFVGSGFGIASMQRRQTIDRIKNLIYQINKR